MVRTRWASLLAGDPALPTAYALESVLDEVVYIAGPVLVTTLAAHLFAAAGLGANSMRIHTICRPAIRCVPPQAS